jgi:hypothetical protein
VILNCFSFLIYSISGFFSPLLWIGISTAVFIVFFQYTILGSMCGSLCSYCPFHADPALLRDFLSGGDGSGSDTTVQKIGQQVLRNPSQARIVAADSK